MKFTQKKSCEGCRALSLDRCDLNFKNRHDPIQPWKAPVPLEPCPKPQTYEQYFTERKRQQEELGVDTLKQ